jgi:hypothetical protein
MQEKPKKSNTGKRLLDDAQYDDIKNDGMTAKRPTSDQIGNMSKVYNVKTPEGLFLNREEIKA